MKQSADSLRQVISHLSEEILNNVQHGECLYSDTEIDSLLNDLHEMTRKVEQLELAIQEEKADENNE